MKKVIITGVSGFIGSALVKQLRTTYEIIGIDKVSSAESIKNCKMFIPEDINNLDKNKLRYIGKVYAVIHLAAKAGVRESQDNFEQYVHDNILGTKSILDACVKSWKPKILMVASSSSIFGDSEKDVMPKSLYAVSKVTTEEIVKSYVRNGLLDCTWSIIKPYTVYGPNQRIGLAIRDFIYKALKDKPLTIYGNGTQSRDFTYIDDLVECIDNKLNGDFISRDMRVGSAESYTINEIIYKISNILNKPVTIRYEPMNRFDVMKTCSPYPCIDETTPIDEGLKKQIEWQIKEMKNSG